VDIIPSDFSNATSFCGEFFANPPGVLEVVLPGERVVKRSRVGRLGCHSKGIIPRWPFSEIVILHYSASRIIMKY
jgi:hypothetical protein